MNRAPSMISDNYGGTLELTRRVLANCEREYGEKVRLLFVGGRGTDHNTMERVRGFRDAHLQAGITVDETLAQTCGYAPEKAGNAMRQLAERTSHLPRGMFVNSTISLEGVMRWIRRSGQYADGVPHLGCFDWEPFVAMLGDHIEMVKQDVPKMLEAVFGIIDSGSRGNVIIKVPAIVEKLG